MNRLYFKAALLALCIFYIPKISLSQAGTVPLPIPTGGFKIDGFLERQTDAGDWLKGNSPFDAAGTFIFSSSAVAMYPNAYHLTDLFGQVKDDIFGKGKFQDDPNTMTWRSAKPQARNDLNNNLLYITQDASGHYWVIIAVDRLNNQSNTFIDFEFLQNTVTKTGGPIPGGTGGFHSSGPDGGRTIGDIVITANFQSDFASTTLYRWVAKESGIYNYVPVVGAPGGVFCSANSTTINVPYGAFGSTVYPPNSFMEIAIDMTALGVLVVDNCGNNLAQSFKSIWIKSKASTANANLLDFIEPFQLGSIVEGPPPPPINQAYTVHTDYFFYDLQTAQLTATVTPGPQEDYNFLWVPLGAVIDPTGDLSIDPTITGTLNNYEISNPIFTADPNHYCITYLYYINVFRRSDGCLVARMPVLVNSPCKIGKPINPDRMNVNQNPTKEAINEKIDISVYPNPNSGTAIIVLPEEMRVSNIDLINGTGQLVRQWKEINSGTLQVNNLSPGFYLLRVVSKQTGKLITKKIIVNR